MIKYEVGDLLKSSETHIAHGCNMQGVMGAGIAGRIAQRWPEVEAEYQRACTLRKFHLGTCQPVAVLDVDLTVFNLATQRKPGADGSYWGVMLAMGNLFEYCVLHEIDRVGVPRIGCGIARLNWSHVEWVINGVYEWVPNGPDIVVYTLPSEVHKW